MDFGLRWKTGTALFALAMLFGCGGDDPALGGGDPDDGGESSDDGPDAQALPEDVVAFIALRCEQASACDCAGALPEDDCIEADTAAWHARAEFAQSRVEDGTWIYDPECIVANRVVLEDAGCRWPSTAIAGGPHLCERYCALYYGGRGLGESCEGYDLVASDCQRGLLCQGGVCTEPCATLSGLALGQTCGNETSGPYEQCTQGAYCDWSSQACLNGAQLGESCFDRACADELRCDWNTERCIALPGPGESCQDNGWCRADLYCDWSAAVPTCRPPAVAGQPCESVPCIEELVCSAGACQSPPPIGQPCVGGRCADDAMCDWNENLCVAAPTVGAPCLFGQCVKGLWCDTATDPNGICATVGELGDPCTGHSRCDTGYCPRGYCEARPGEGEDCSILLICERGLVCDGAICRPTSYSGPAACVYDGW